MRLLTRSSALFTVSVMATWGMPQVPSDEAGKTGTIRVTVVNSFGRPLPDATVRLEATGKPTRALTAGRGNEIPYGKYRVTAEIVNHAPAAVEIDVHEPDAILVIGLVPYALLAEQNSVTVKGTLEGDVASDCRVIRMVPLFTNGPAYDAIVLQNQFVVGDARAGRYTVVLIGSSGVCRVSQATVGLGSRFQTVSVP